MPFCLKDRDISADIAGLDSVLIVPCRFCPAANLAVRERKPYIKLFRKLLRTPSYESYIEALRSRLQSAGVRAAVFDSRWPHQFVACMWTHGRRRQLAREAVRYEGVIVLGCDAAVETARSCLPAGCRLIPGMEVEGIMTVIPTVSFPFNVSLEVSSLTRLHA
jgi:hypothetical protein